MISISQEEIMQNWSIKNTETPLVSVRCITYNHEPYIAQAIDGFLMQKTNFPFEVVIHDDASTDRTAEIIREYEKKYPLIIKPIYQTENQYSKGNGSVSKAIDPKLKGKYIAFCEGDDYWIDPNKLQMQVDFLEKNPEYGICYTKTKCYVQARNRYIRPFGKNIKSFEDLLFNGNRIPTLTVVVRTNLYFTYKDEIHPEQQNWLMGDYPIWLWIAHKSKVKFLSYITAVYRVLRESASHSYDIEKQLIFSKSYHNIQNYFIERYTSHKRIEFNEKSVRVWLMAINSLYSREEVLSIILSLNKFQGKDKILLFICRNSILFFLLRLRWKVQGILR